MRRLYWLRILVLVGWVVVIPPVMSATEGFYVGNDGRPAVVAVTDPLFEWTIYGHYNSGSECDAARAALQRRSLHLDPANATAASWSFAKCLAEDSPLLRPDRGPTEELKLPPSNQSAKGAARGKQP